MVNESGSIVNPKQGAYVQLHIAVLLFGITGILGRLIELPETVLVWWRMLITVLSLLLIPGLVKGVFRIPKRTISGISATGVVVALHWIFFFGAIHWSNVSIALICLATASFFTTLLEPLILKTGFKWHEALLGLMIVPGMYLIVQDVPEGMMVGVFAGILSAVLAAFFSILNKKWLIKTRPLPITLLELGSGWLFICFLLPFYILAVDEVRFWPTPHEWVYLGILAILCTTVAFVLTLNALQHLTPFTTNLTINLEPVYAIILAWLIFSENEDLGSRFYFGSLVIIAALFANVWLQKRFGERLIR